MYKYDLHTHTSEVSPCASMSGADQARAYKAAGYTGIIITDHYYDGFFEKLGDMPWEGKIREYYAGYRAAREEGEAIGIDIFAGAEVTLRIYKRDFLVFGVDMEFFIKNPKLYEMNIHDFCSVVHKAGGLVFMAHPYRPEAPPEGLLEAVDGVEVYNGNPATDNQSAKEYANEYGLLKCSGSDAHHKDNTGLGGVIIDTRIADVKEMASFLKNGNLKLIGI